jgi:phosphopantetheinyl transferase (holo-ACP synthase)
MISAGNDIVSLTATNVTRSKSAEFYSKIISPAEKALFNTLDQEALPFDRFVWLLWSIKESAYKYLHRLDPDIVFTPVKFEVRSIHIPAAYTFTDIPGDDLTASGFGNFSTFNSIAVFDKTQLFSRTIIHHEFIASVVNDNEYFENIHWGIKQIADISYKSQSLAVKQFALDAIGKIKPLRNPSVVKSETGAPVLKDDRLTLPLSLSHHEHWIAFSTSMP